MIDEYLRELARELPSWLPVRRRILAEAEDHLRESAREHGEREAVARFGAPADVARSFAPVCALSASRVAALAVFALLAVPVLTYPVVENALPPAPWPEGAMPGHLAWKQDALAALYLAAAVAAAATGLLFRRGRGLLVADASALVPLVAAAAVSAALGVQWAEAVAGTPPWLHLVWVANSAAAALAVAAAARALSLHRV